MRLLVCIGGTQERLLPDPSPRVKVRLPAGRSWKIIEDRSEVTPIDLQQTHVVRQVAEWLAMKLPGIWQIVECGEIEELERICA